MMEKWKRKEDKSRMSSRWCISAVLLFGVYLVLSMSASRGLRRNMSIDDIQEGLHHADKKNSCSVPNISQGERAKQFSVHNTKQGSNNQTVAIIMSGLDTRLSKVAIDSLAEHIIRPYTTNNYAVHVFAVLQKQDSLANLRKIDKSAWDITNDENRTYHLYQYLQHHVCEAGGQLIKFLLERPPTTTELRTLYGIRNRTRLGGGTKTKQRLWLRNLVMYHNMMRGFQEAQKVKNYFAYIRTRTDNVFFSEHPVHLQFKTTDTIVMGCRAFGGFNDKFVVMKTRTSASAFFDVLKNAKLINSNYYTSETMWRISFRQNNVSVALAYPDDDNIRECQKTYGLCFPYPISVAHVSMSSDNRPCYRSYTKCVTEDLKKKIENQGSDCPFDNHGCPDSRCYAHRQSDSV